MSLLFSWQQTSLWIVRFQWPALLPPKPKVLGFFYLKNLDLRACLFPRQRLTAQLHNKLLSVQYLSVAGEVPAISTALYIHSTFVPSRGLIFVFLKSGGGCQERGLSNLVKQSVVCTFYRGIQC